MEARGNRGPTALRLFLGALLAFIGSLTFGNAPYPFFGYGLSAFALFAIGLTYPPRQALLSFVTGTVVGTAVILQAQSLFAFVAIGVAIVRILQLVLLVRLRPRIGPLAAGLVTLLVATFLGIGVGLATFGEGATMTAFDVFDVVFLGAALLLARIATTNIPRPLKIARAALVVGGTVGAFVSASTFLLLAPLVVSLLALLAASLLIWRGPPAGLRGRPSGEVAAPIVVLAVLFGVLVVSAPATGYAMRALAYPLYPDSWSAHQWIQTSGAAGCRSGNTAGAGTVANGTWGPSRLRVLSTCVTVSGVIEDLIPSYGPAVDGDYAFDLRLDPGQDWTLSLGSYVLNGGMIHIEVVPSDQPSVLRGLMLTPGNHVQVTGVWVLDTDHGWTSEIHPAWSVIMLGS